MAQKRKHEGQTSGKSVMWYQDWTFTENDRRQLTDEQLLEDWRREFPNALGQVFTASFDDGLKILRAVRAHYNIGRQGHGLRNDRGDTVGGANQLSLPYAADGRTLWYSERWLDGVLNARLDLRDPR